MDPILRFAEHDRVILKAELLALELDPYCDYDSFHSAVGDLIGRDAIPPSFIDACRLVSEQRDQQQTDAHLLSNCPLDDVVPVFDQQDPVADKYKKKATYVGEGMLELLSQLTDAPLLSYTTRNNGDFFHDVYADKRYS